MCELFGMSAQHNVFVNDYLKTFYQRSDKHPHGWGLARLDGHSVNIEKEPIQATESHYLKERIKMPIWEKAVLAHIRYATIGNLEYKNCHPYTREDNMGRRWTLIHNGTIFDCPKLSKYLRLQMGDTDSERILYYIVDRMEMEERRLKRPLEAEERFALMDDIIEVITPNNKVNMMVYDEEYLYVHTNYKDTLYSLDTGNAIYFATAPLSDEDWIPVPFTQLLIYKENHLVFEGHVHGHEYIDNEENMKMIFQAFSEL